jgi:hypothetical protein
MRLSLRHGYVETASLFPRTTGRRRVFTRGAAASGRFGAVAAGRSAQIQQVPGGVMNVAVDALARRASGERPSVLRSALAAAVVGGAAAAITYYLLRRSGGETEAE